MPAARDGMLDGMAAHHRAMGLVEAAAHGFGEAGTRRGDDDGLFHEQFSLKREPSVAVEA